MISRVFLVGFMGSGKSTLGSLLANHLRYDFIDLDDWIELQNGTSITQLFSTVGESEFRIIERDALREIGIRNQLVLACGGGTPCHHQNMEWMNKTGTTIFLNTSVPVLLQRLLPQQAHRPLIAGKDEIELKSFIENKIRERFPYYAQANIEITGMDTPQDLVKWLLPILLF